MELSFLYWIQNTLRSPLMDTLMKGVSALGNLGMLWIVIGVILLLHPGYRKGGLFYFVVLLLSVLFYSVLLKPIVARPRPFTIAPNVLLLLKEAPSGYSFPSGHAMAAFTCVGVLFQYPIHRKIQISLLLLSCFIAFSRLYLFVHYPSDVLSGMLLGGLIGWGSPFLPFFPFPKNKPDTMDKTTLAKEKGQE